MPYKKGDPELVRIGGPFRGIDPFEA